MRSTLRKPAVYEARRARQDLSLPEVLLWQRLKGAPDGIRFRKQHPVGPYLADFYCAAARLIIEIDGVAHNAGNRPQRDATRTAWLENAGYSVVRIPAAAVLRDADEMARAILALAARPLHRASRAVPLPVNGEELP